MSRTNPHKAWVTEALEIMATGPSHPDYYRVRESLMEDEEPELLEAVHLLMEDRLGALPPPSGFSSQNEPFWSTEIIANHMNLPIALLEEEAEEAFILWEERSGVRLTETLYRLH
ncbi:MAG: hypothetical protein HQL57_01100 [Magnetococcales bacterium]|nr:hypothetical protein [Magnetococcales bacterium]MBF0155768.1 hypothetical protein [Magnetococcales bacterium]